MNHLFYSLLILVVFSQSQNIQAQVVWPWPTGSECPLEWSALEGAWQPQKHQTHFSVGEQELSGTFEFTFQAIEENGNRHFLVKRLNGADGCVGVGLGISEPQGKYLVAKIQPNKGSECRSETEKDPYWVIIRSFSKEGRTCTRPKDRLMTLTIRPCEGAKCKNKEEEAVEMAAPYRSKRDQNYLIEKIILSGKSGN